ncbi:MAG: DsbA family protein [Coriobacteriales bacterium]|jgi:putative protein-disulfide isomerase
MTENTIAEQASSGQVPEKRLEIAHFTDPMCFWCYAMEPEVRKIRMLLDGKLDYRIVMGVLSSDVQDFGGNDDWSEMQYSFFRIELADHLTKAAAQVGMPFAADYLQSCSPEELVSLPMCKAYCAMKMLDEGCAEVYLRRMRECVFAEGRGLGTTDQLVELAEEFPVDAVRFRTILETDEMEPILAEGLSECHDWGVTAFPTLLMQYGDSRLIISGYCSYQQLRQAILQVTGGAVDPGEATYSLEELEAYMERFGKAAAREIKVMFSLDDDQLADAIMDLVSTGRYTTQSCQTSFFAVSR